MNIEVNQFKKIPGKLLKPVRRYTGITFILVTLLIYSFLIFQIGRLTQAEPSEEEVSSKLNTVKRLKVDKEAVNKIQELEDQNVQVRSLFNDARNNPF